MIELEDFARLQKAWARTRAGTGGFVALSGFDFQITQAILEAIRAQSQGHGIVLMEVLSDIFREAGGALVVAQLKRTLSSAAVSKAMEEFWSIEGVARKDAPSLRGFLKYEVQGARSGLKDVLAAVERWKPESEYEANDLREFKARITSSISSAPRVEAAKLLVDQYADPHPFQTIDKFAGRLLRISSSAEATAVAKAIEEDLFELKSSALQREVQFRIWGSNDQPPKEVKLETDPRFAVRIGERLTPADLIGGRLADRSIYRQIHEAAEEWLLDAEGAPEKVPCFWIEGRSGAGKSAALLYLVSQLHAEDPERIIIWLGSRPDRIGETFARFRDVVAEGRQLVVAVDDPLSPTRLNGLSQAVQQAADEWGRLQGTSGTRAATRPVLVCCGPTEQRVVGEDTFYEELEILPYSLPKESDADLEELADWYQKRTGQRPPDIDGDILLVQRFFEWNKGEIRDFALRFRARLEGLSRTGQPISVFEMVARILAFGRLYADYPAAAISEATAHDEHLARALEQLADGESHLSFLPEEGGVRLTHPHLADAIYREWFGRPQDWRDRQRHLVEGLRASMSRRGDEPEVRLGPLWAITRLVRSQDGVKVALPDVRARVDLVQSELIAALPELYAEFLEGCSELSDLPVWMVLDRSLNLNLSPNPSETLSRVIDRTTEPAKGLRLSCHIALHFGAASDIVGARNRVVALLNRLLDWRDAEDLPWRDWAFIAIDVIRCGGAAELVDPVLALVDSVPRWKHLELVVRAISGRGWSIDAATVGAAWMSATEEATYRWADLLRNLMGRRVPTPNLGTFAYRFLLTQPHHPQWPAIWEEANANGVIDASKLEALALSWLGVVAGDVPPAHPATHGYDRMLDLALQHAKADSRVALTTLAFEWLRAAGNGVQGWSYVWSSLWKFGQVSSADRDELREFGLSGLRGNPHHFGWSFVWHAFADERHGVDRAALVELGLDWLEETRPTHAGWPYVFETILESADGNPDLKERVCNLAVDWLISAPQHRGWSTVWLKVYAAKKGDGGATLDIARSWLGQASINNPSWRSVARVILPRISPAADDGAQLSSAASLWLHSNPENRDWIKVLEASTGLLTEAELEAFEAEALSRALQSVDRVRPYTVKFLYDRAKDPNVRAELAKRLIEWLPGHLSHREWTTAWILLVHSSADHSITDNLLDLAELWWEHGGLARTSWPFFWPTWRHFLIKRGRDSRLRDGANIASDWLITHSVSHRKWGQIWMLLERDDPALACAAPMIPPLGERLLMASDEPEPWSKMFLIYAKEDSSWSAKEQLCLQLVAWLDVNGTAAKWPDLMNLSLKRVDAHRARLLELAISWLGSEQLHRSWPFVWRSAATAAKAPGSAQDALLDLLIARLEAAPPSQIDWSELFRRARTFSADRSIPQSIVTAAVARIQRDSFDAWPIARAEIPNFARNFSAEALIELLVASAERPRAFSYIWSDYVKVAGPADRLRAGEVALGWLQGHPDDRSWPWIWRDIWDRWPELGRALKEIGHQWYKDHPEATDRYHVRKRLFPHRQLKKPLEPKL